LRRAFRQPIRYTREGGSGSAVDLREVVDAPVLFLGISVPSDCWPAPNGKVEPDLFLKGVGTSGYLWGEVSQSSREAH
jgi:hypothetical protein